MRVLRGRHVQYYVKYVNICSMLLFSQMLNPSSMSNIHKQKSFMHTNQHNFMSSCEYNYNMTHVILDYSRL